MKVANKAEVLKKTAGFSTEMSSAVASLLEELFPVEHKDKAILAKYIKNLLVNVYQVEEKFENIINTYNQIAEDVNAENKKSIDITNDIQSRKENK